MAAPEGPNLEALLDRQECIRRHDLMLRDFFFCLGLANFLVQLSTNKMSPKELIGALLCSQSLLDTQVDNNACSNRE